MSSPLIWQADKSNIFIRPMCFARARMLHDGHTHHFDHTVVVHTGAVRATVRFLDGREHTEDFRAPAHFLIDAELTHKITCIRPTDAEVIQAVEAMSPDQMRAELIRLKTVPTQAWCVYAHRDPQGEVIQRNIGWDRAYGGVTP